MARIGLKGLTCALFASGGAGSAVTYTANSGITAANLMISADVSLNRDDAKLSADDHVVERVNGITGGTISLELASLPQMPLFDRIARAGDIPSRDMYNTFNMGVGMCVTVPEDQADQAVLTLIECGEQARVIGTVAEGDERVMLV